MSPVHSLSTPTASARLRERSFWLDSLADGPSRAALDGDQQVDVAIVGGGTTGLWAAHYLLTADPSLRVLIIEATEVGFGASGRNGGWCVGELAAGPERIEAAAGNAAARQMLRALFDTVDDVGRVCADLGIDCHYTKGGTIRLARNGAHLARLRDEVEHLHTRFGLDDDDIRLLGADEARTHLAATSVIGGAFFAHTAALHPARLVRSLADAVERAGATIVEHTRAISIAPGAVTTDRGTVRADMIVRATEGYTSDLDGHARSMAPLYSLMVVTDPIPADVWAEIGLGRRQTFGDGRHLVIYGQRTADDRIAFGGRGARYPFASRINPNIEMSSRVHDRITAALRELLPQLSDVGITHRWGGVLGIPRDWFPSVGIDRSAGIAWAGGYVGEGVAASHLGGRTVADLIAGVDTPRTELPWVGHRSRTWEPEPLRWMAINGALVGMEIGDRSEARRGRSSRLAGTLERLVRR
ncbi:MAG: FAD-binding oxidoreductase [Actinomycetota bacterium]|nr:FAD-binding oxidoreductase [Actinomycetota bacterium]